MNRKALIPDPHRQPVPAQAVTGRARSRWDNEGGAIPRVGTPAARIQSKVDVGDRSTLKKR